MPRFYATRPDLALIPTSPAPDSRFAPPDSRHSLAPRACVGAGLQPGLYCRGLLVHLALLALTVVEGSAAEGTVAEGPLFSPHRQQKSRFSAPPAILPAPQWPCLFAGTLRPAGCVSGSLWTN